MYKTVNINGYKVSKPFRILTDISCYDIDSDSDDYVEQLEQFSEKQYKVLNDFGYDLLKYYDITFGSGFTYDVTIDDAIQMLALKDGADVVEFSDGTIGFVGYYNGFNENYFYINK